MKTIFTVIFSAIMTVAYCQSQTFSWYNQNNSSRNYISPAKDQGEQGPCRTFAAVAAVEAICHIYYNKPFSSGTNGINLSEAEIYSGCSGYGASTGSASIEEALYYIDTTGIINESCFAYPDNSPFFRTDCLNICPTPSYEVNIPGFEQLNLNSTGSETSYY